MANRAEEHEIKRAPLRRKGVYVIASSYGNKHGDFRVGQVVGYGKNLVEVVFKDNEAEGQEFSWRFSLRSGVRTQDIGSSTGWRIDLGDLDDWRPPAIVHKPKTRTRKLHEEAVELSNGEEVVIWQVFRDETNGRLYFKSFRRNKETGKERPYAAPIEKVLEILHQFVKDW